MLLVLLAVSCITPICGWLFKRLAKKFNWEIERPLKSRWWQKLLGILAAVVVGMLLVFVYPVFQDSADKLHQLGHEAGDLLALALIWVPLLVGSFFSAWLSSICILISSGILERMKIENRKWTFALSIYLASAVGCCLATINDTSNFLQPRILVYVLKDIAPAFVCAIVCRYFEDKIHVQEA